jgi:hypothetical protein
MPESPATAKLKVVTIIGPAAFESAIIELLRSAHGSGYTVTKAAGFGLHGASRPGLIDAGNVRVEVLLAADAARRLLASVVAQMAKRHVIAFMVDAEAVPLEHFEP